MNALDSGAYELLKRQRRAAESFSDVVKRLASPRRPISTFAGVWSDMSAKERKMLNQTHSSLREAGRHRVEKIRRLWGVR